MDKKQKQKILKKLRNDADYYGDFGKQFLSNSDIYHLLNNPIKFHHPRNEILLPPKRPLTNNHNRCNFLNLYQNLQLYLKTSFSISAKKYGE